MIVTVTPNPSVDRTLDHRPLGRGELIRAGRRQPKPGARGQRLGRPRGAGPRDAGRAPLAQDPRQIFRALLAGAIPIDAVPIAGELRTNLSLVEDDGTVTKVNEPGPKLTDEVDAILTAAAQSASQRGSSVAGRCRQERASTSTHA